MGKKEKKREGKERKTERRKVRYQDEEDGSEGRIHVYVSICPSTKSKTWSLTSCSSRKDSGKAAKQCGGKVSPAVTAASAACAASRRSSSGKEAYSAAAAASWAVLRGGRARWSSARAWYRHRTGRLAHQVRKWLRRSMKRSSSPHPEGHLKVKGRGLGLGGGRWEVGG